jgi:hypothetical protein
MIIRWFEVLTAAVVFTSLALVGCSSGPEVSPPVTTTQVAVTSLNTVAPLPAVPAIPAVGSLGTDEDPHVLFVDPVSGRDDNDGQTAARPWASLQYGLNQLSPGDTLYLMGGEYRDAIKPGTSHFVLTASGTPDAWIRVAAAPGQDPVVVAEAGNAFEVRGSYVEVSGLRIMGRGFGTDNAYGWGLLTRSNHHVRFLGNTVWGMPVGGITSVEATNLEIVENIVHDNSFWGPEQGSGISLWRSRDAGTDPAPDGYHDRIIGNIVYHNENRVFSEWRDHPVITDGNGIIVDFSKELGYTGRILIANNVVFDNGGRGVLVLESSRVDIMHNTTYHNGRTDGLEGGPAELVAGRSSDVQFLNNVVWSRPGSPALLVRESDGVVSGGNAYVTDVANEIGSDADLLFTDNPGVVSPSVDPAQADFHLTVGSGLVDRALPTDPFVPEDADRRPRPAQGADIGAYELAATP